MRLETHVRYFPPSKISFDHKIKRDLKAYWVVAVIVSTPQGPEESSIWETTFDTKPTRKQVSRCKRLALKLEEAEYDFMLNNLFMEED